MQEDSGLQSLTFAGSQEKSQITNLIAVLNLQEYLKYLILTTSIEPQPDLNPQKLLQSKLAERRQLEETNSMRIETENFEEELKLADNAVSDKSCCCTNSTGSFTTRRKRSSKLFQKRFIRKSKNANTHVIFQDSNDTHMANDVPIGSKVVEKITAMKNVWKRRSRKTLDIYNRGGEKRKKPWNCSHDRLFGLGMCKECYFLKLNMKKKFGECSVQNQAQDETAASFEHPNDMNN